MELSIKRYDMNRKKDGIQKWRPKAIEMDVDPFGYKTPAKKKAPAKVDEKKPEPAK